MEAIDAPKSLFMPSSCPMEETACSCHSTGISVPYCGAQQIV